MYLTCFKDSLPILSDSYQVIFASKLSYGCWHKPLPYGCLSRFHGALRAKRGPVRKHRAPFHVVKNQLLR